jgi:hypothetical protein
MLSLFALGLVLPSQALEQCMDTLPDGTKCGADEYFENYPDPDACSMYYQCNAGCFSHYQCQEDFRYDAAYKWCTHPFDVDCGDRPCTDPGHCYTTTERTTTEDCGHILDCDAAGVGYWPDPFNCRKYWHCLKHGLSTHHICPAGELYDLVYDGCNWENLVDCGERPICGDCDEDCVTPPTPPPTVSPTISPDCGNHTDFCHHTSDGYFPDPFNCRKYWHCLHHEGAHYKCDNEMLFDTVYNGCNFPNLVDCGNRPVCGDCDEDCHDQDGGDNHDPADCNNSGENHDFDCSTKPLGWFTDPYNCRKYYHCDSNYGTAKTHYLCPTAGTVFDLRTVSCDWEDRVTCGTRPICDDCDENCRMDPSFH